MSIAAIEDTRLVVAPGGDLRRGGRQGWLYPILRAPFAGRTWRANLYMLLGAALAVPGAALVVVTTVLGIGLTLTFLGLPLLALGGVLAIRLGDLHRALAARLLGETVPSALPRPAGKGVLGRLQARLTDPVAWRARLYLVAKLPVALLACYAAAVCYFEGLLMVTYPLWWAASPPSPRTGTRPPGVTDLGAAIDRGSPPKSSHLAHQLTLHFGGLYLDTWPRTLATAVVGVLVLLAAPWMGRGMARVDLAPQRALLGPTARSRHVEQLEAARSTVAQDAAATLRRIERDLHDGTQAQLVTLAMNLGAMRERLEDQSPAERDASMMGLVAITHDQAKDALDELRNLTRGIHPPALDLGLANALATLVARSAVPASFCEQLTSRPTPAIETIAYYSVAELLTNVAKHSDATTVDVTITERDGRLKVTVRDDGHGGADPAGGSGLQGLAARLEALDASLTVDSPIGGPTLITLDLPMRI